MGGSSVGLLVCVFVPGGRGGSGSRVLEVGELIGEGIARRWSSDG